MANYLNAFYGATNAFCDTMTSATYNNEEQGVNMTQENNKLLGHEGYKYHLSAGHAFSIPSYSMNLNPSYKATASNHPTESQMIGALKGAGCFTDYNSAAVRQMFSKNTIIRDFNMGVQLQWFDSYHVAKHKSANVTISQLVAHEQSLAKTASPDSMRGWANLVQQANTEFSNIKNQAQAGTSQINAWVEKDTNDLAAAANLLSSVLQSLASPITVS
jgi:hypothetical protein